MLFFNKVLLTNKFQEKYHLETLDANPRQPPFMPFLPRTEVNKFYCCTNL